jgi:hypothetical protein
MSVLARSVKSFMCGAASFLLKLGWQKSDSRRCVMAPERQKPADIARRLSQRSAKNRSGDSWRAISAGF